MIWNFRKLYLKSSFGQDVFLAYTCTIFLAGKNSGNQSKIGALEHSLTLSYKCK